MKTRKWAIALMVGLGIPVAAMAEDSLVRFEGGIGSQPLRAGAAINTARGVNPGGTPWVIARLSADVKTDGRISVDGRGLLLGGGNNVGGNGGQSVRARLFCGDVATATTHDSELVPLDVEGDFRIGGVVTPMPPDPCTNAVLLIVSGGGSWFAAGIPKF